jgi:hypothetical protein
VSTQTIKASDMTATVPLRPLKLTPAPDKKK